MTLKDGDLAYYDSLAGLIPCKVLEITGRSGFPSTDQRVLFTVTVTRGAYKRGEQVETLGTHVVPRKAVHGNQIRPYTVQATEYA